VGEYAGMAVDTEGPAKRSVGAAGGLPAPVGERDGRPSGRWAFATGRTLVTAGEGFSIISGLIARQPVL
jgi:hypothetical protein